MLHVQLKQHLVPHCELHVPQGGIELRLAPVLPLPRCRESCRKFALLLWRLIASGARGTEYEYLLLLRSFKSYANIRCHCCQAAQGHTTCTQAIRRPSCKRNSQR